MLFANTAIKILCKTVRGIGFDWKNEVIILANKRQIDKSKKSNIKCEHREYWSGYDESGRFSSCTITDEQKDYYQRCKQFDWKKDAVYTDSKKPVSVEGFYFALGRTGW